MAFIVWGRITYSRITMFYFLFSLAHCIIQVLFQGQAFQINASAANLIDTVLHTANATSPGFALLEDDLVWCKVLPKNGRKDGTGCSVIWAPDGATNITTATPTGVRVLGTTSTAVPAGALSALSGIQTLPSDNAALTPIPSAVAPDLSQPQATVTNNAQPSSSLPSKRAASPPHDPYLRSDPLFPRPSSQSGKRGIKILVSTIASTTTDANGQVITTITGIPNAPPTLVLGQTCLIALNWPLETLDNTKREDITFIVFHFWVLGMSVVALLNESIPHMIASLVTHVIVTAWSAFQLVQTRTFQNDFSRIITNGACTGQNILPTYWKDRANAEIPAAALNGAALIISALLTFKLVKTYNWATFKRIGASRTISKVYKIVLSLSVVLQLSLFFIVVSIALWIDQLCNGVIGKLATHMALYRGTYISVLLLLVPWIVIGWKAVRLERRNLMHVFLVFNVILIGGWASMFSSITFRWTFLQWHFFAVMSVAAVTLSLITLVLGIMCRRNFGSDLPKYLNAQMRIEDDEEFVSATDDVNSEKGSGGWSSDPEKISFPSPGPVPTFVAAFGSNPPSRTTSNTSSNSIAQHFPPPVSLASPPAAHLPSRFSEIGGVLEPERDPRRISIGSAHSATSIDLPRSGSRTSGGSVRRNESASSAGGRKLMKRWVIE